MERMNSPQWISSTFTADSDGTFRISGISINDIVSSTSLPVYVYDAAIIKNQFDALVRTLKPHGIGVYYSVKANTSLAILQIMKLLGAGFEIASLGELLAVQKAGVDPTKVSFAGPVKTSDELSRALDFGIHIINVETIDEVYLINKLAKERGVIQKIGLRVNPQREVQDAGGFMGGGSQKFGFDEEMISKQFIKNIVALPYINLVGIHVFAATQILNAKVFLANLQNTCSIAEKLNHFFKVSYIDFGGGLGIPYKQDEQHLPLDEVAKQLGKVLGSVQFLKENKTSLSVEPGRYLVGPSGMYLTSVNAVKKSRGKNIVLVDGGIHHMLRPALAVGYNAHPIYNLSRIHEDHRIPFDIGGSLCTSLDFLGKDVLLPETKPGDVIGIFQAGAYGWSEAMPYFLSHTIPGEVLVVNGAFYSIRKPVHPSEFFNNQIFLNIRREQI